MLQDSGGGTLWGPANSPPDALLHPLPCTLALLPTGALSLLDANNHQLWSSASSSSSSSAASQPDSGPYLLICSAGTVELVDSDAQVLWRAQGSALSASTPPPPMMGERAGALRVCGVCEACVVRRCSL